MVQSTARGGKPTKPARKPAYRPRITFLSATEYLVPSEHFAGHIIYKVTVMPSGRAQCECKASDLGKPCKHGRLALAAHAYRASPPPAPRHPRGGGARGPRGHCPGARLHPRPAGLL